MNVLVHFRGGIGDACIWMQKLAGLFDFHKKDNITFVINARCGISLILKLFTLNQQFRTFLSNGDEQSIFNVNYHNPANLTKIKKLVKHDIFYNFDAWVNNGWNKPVSEVYPELGLDLFPVTPKPVKMKLVTICPNGYHIKNTWTDKKWHELARLIETKGYKARFVGNYRNNILPEETFIKIISSSSLCISVDTGARNLAMINGIPVIELGTPGKGDPNFDIFHPKEYRNNTKYYPDIDKVTVEQIFEESIRMIHG
jgi:ADP-heptose:LPS heptosyltransferase